MYVGRAKDPHDGATESRSRLPLKRDRRAGARSFGDTDPPPSSRARGDQGRRRGSIPPTPRPAPKKSARAIAAARAARLSSRTPEEHLALAMNATTPRSRGIWARRGLACRSRIDRTTQSMLLRQLYLSHFEQHHFRDAFEIASQSLALGVLPDVVHQDIARASVALGDVDVAAQHLRRAARVGPPSRRAFHWWTLGSIFFVAGRLNDAIGALERAARWGTRDKPLYQGHLAIARIASGERISELGDLLRRLREVPAGQGYGRFVLGHMAFHARRFREARTHLEAFVARSTTGRPAMTIALEGEVRLARQVLARMTNA